MISLTEILPDYPEIRGIHPACDAVPAMSEEEFKELAEDIRRNGLANPLMLTPDKLLLDGRHRLMACYEQHVEVRYDDTTVEPWTYVCSLNIKRRHLTIGQKAMFAQAMFEAEQAVAKKRKVEAGKQYGRGHQKVQATLPEPISKPAPQARDKVAVAVGVGQKAIQKAKMIREHAPVLAEEVKSGKMDLEPAYREAKKIIKQTQSRPVESPPLLKSTVTAFIVTVGGEKRPIQKPSAVRFNKTNDSVDWARWTWNPITGCLHGCSFCYAREIALSQRMSASYPFGFEPAFHEYRLDAPGNTPLPKSDDPREGRVFVCSMADLFGKWVPDEWIQKVFAACEQAPLWEYLFLTKWPNKYAQVPLLKKAWYGASVIQQSDVARVEKAMTSFDSPGCIKWVSMEPMLEPIHFNDLSWCDFLVIGSQTSTNQPDGFQPAMAARFDDIVDVVNQCREAKVPYYLKANLGSEAPGMLLPKMTPRR